MACEWGLNGRRTTVVGRSLDDTEREKLGRVAARAAVEADSHAARLYRQIAQQLGVPVPKSDPSTVQTAQTYFEESKPPVSSLGQATLFSVDAKGSQVDLSLYVRREDSRTAGGYLHASVDANNVLRIEGKLPTEEQRTLLRRILREALIKGSREQGMRFTVLVRQVLEAIG
jgi:hypothetical protein